MEELAKIREILNEYDRFIALEVGEPTDKNIALYEHWIDCKSDVEEQLKQISDLEDNGLLLPIKDKLINALAEIALNSKFGRCYMCTNSMKNITLDGVNNGCDGNCGHEEFTTDDLIKKVAEELRYKAEAEQKLKETEGK